MNDDWRLQIDVHEEPRAEGTWAKALSEGPSNPFAVLGGLGG
jgi:hypothetical protein